MSFAHFKQYFFSRTFLRFFSRSFVRRRRRCQRCCCLCCCCCRYFIFSLLLARSLALCLSLFILFISLARTYTCSSCGPSTVFVSFASFRSERYSPRVDRSLRLKLYSTQFSLTLQFCHPFRRYRFLCFRFRCANKKVSAQQRDKGATSK